MKQPRSLALITSIAFSIPNFRGALIREMVARGATVFCLAPDYDDKTRAQVLALGAKPIDISLDRTGMHPIRDALDTIRLARVLHRLKPDATFGYFIKPVIYGTIAAVMAGVPRRNVMIAGLGYVFTEAASDTVRRRVLRGVVARLYKFALSRAHVVFFQNTDDCGQFVRGGLVDPARAIVLAGSGVDVDAFAPAPLPSGPPVFLLVARLLREKGIAEFVAAGRLLRGRGVQARYVLVGGTDPNPGGFAAEEVSTWVENGDVEWLGQVGDVRSAIAASSVFVLPSYREGKPRSTQEAMAMARAIVTTDAPGCRDTVAEGVNGFKVPVRDVPALADAMQRLVEAPRLMAEMGAASRRMAEETFDVRKINAVMLAALAFEPTKAPDEPLRQPVQGLRSL